MTSTLAIHARSLSKSFGERLSVDGIDLKIPAGRAYGLLGPNGSGKTTTVRLLTGLLSPESGSVEILGEPLTPASADRLRERIGVQTDTNLYETLSVRENLHTWGELFGMTTERRERRITEILEVFELSDRIDSLVGTLSKGMRQKVSVARAILHEPELLFLDEPTAGLDPEATEELISYLNRLIDASNITVVICTHQLHGLEELCDEVGIIKNGRMLTQGPVPHLLQERWPQHRYRISVAGSPDHTETFEREEQLSALIAQLVAEGAAVRSVVPIIPTIRDLYFAVLGDDAPKGAPQ